MNHRSHRFVQASVQHDWEFATDKLPCLFPTLP